MAPKKSDDKLLEELVEVQQWASANLDVLRLREGGCFKAKLRVLQGGDERRFYNFLFYHRKRLEGNADLATQLANFDRMVLAQVKQVYTQPCHRQLQGAAKCETPPTQG